MTVWTATATRPAYAAQRAGMLSEHDQGLLWDMEEHFWTSGADTARARQATNAVIAVPHPPVILQNNQIWTHLRERTGWRSVAIAERCVKRWRDLAILSYHVLAENRDAPVHEALCASTYFHDEETWLRMSHRQTAVTRDAQKHSSCRGRRD